MALRNVVKFGDEILRKKAKPVTAFDDKLWVLLDDMRETMRHYNGVGLAATQVGILKRVVVIEAGEELLELVNPEVTHMKGKQREIEGCLSSPGQWGYVQRPAKVKVKAQNRYGKEILVEGADLLAIVICHETDHLNGVLFTDKADEMVDEKPEDD